MLQVMARLFYQRFTAISRLSEVDMVLLSHGLLMGLWTYVDPTQLKQKHTMTEFEAFAARVEARELRG